MPKIIYPGGGAGSAGGSISVLDEGVEVLAKVKILNFVGADVEAQQGGDDQVNIYIPTPTYASHFNTEDGTTIGLIQMSGVTPVQKFISKPDSEGTPFYTGGKAETVALASDDGDFSLSTAGPVTAMKDSTFVISVIDAAGAVMETWQSAPITASGVLISPSTFIRLEIGSFTQDSLKYKAFVTVVVKYADILNAAGFTSGPFNVIITHNASDGTGPYVFNFETSLNPGITGPFFYDSNPNEPTLPTNFTIGETAGFVVTKHISGLEYYTLGSRFSITAQDMDYFNNNTALPSNNIGLFDNATYGFNTIYQSPLPGGSGETRFSNWTSAYDNVDVDYFNDAVEINRNNLRYVGTSGRANIRVYRVWGGYITKQTANSNIMVDTVSTQSTDLSEVFENENRRTEADYTTPWDSTLLLTPSTPATSQLKVLNNGLIQNGDNISLRNASGTTRTLTVGTDFVIGVDATATALNISNAINGIYGADFASIVDPYTSTSVNIKQLIEGPSGNQSNSSSRPTAISLDNFEEGSNDALVYYGRLQQPNQSVLDNGVLNADWTNFFPAGNPDYSTLSGPANFYREFIDNSGLSRASMQMVFTGSFASGSATTDLANSDLRIFVRKVSSPTGGALVGASAPPMRVHGGTFGSQGPFDQGATIEGSYIREGSSSGNTVNCTFGTFPCEDGILVEIMIYNPAIKIDRMDVVFF